jgi:hypothetical protein
MLIAHMLPQFGLQSYLSLAMLAWLRRLQLFIAESITRPSDHTWPVLSRTAGKPFYIAHFNTRRPRLPPAPL